MTRPRPWDDGAVEDEIAALERVAAQHWRGTEEEWLGGWLLRAAEGFTGRANSALPLADPGLPLDDALDTVTRWYAARGLPPMIAIPRPLGAGARATGCQLDHQLSERAWLSRTTRGSACTTTEDRSASRRSCERC
jgi:hypothetical protein